MKTKLSAVPPHWRDPQGLLRLLALIAIVYLILPGRLFRYPGLGSDHSWMISLNRAIARGLVFGRELLWTHGPRVQPVALAHSP